MIYHGLLKQVMQNIPQIALSAMLKFVIQYVQSTDY